MATEVVSTERLDLVPMTPDFLESTVENAHADAASTLGLTIPAAWFQHAAFAAMRLRQFKAGETSQPWMPRGIGLRATREMVGFIGFHTPPAPDYLKDICPQGVEFGYEIFPEYRRRRFAREAADAMIQWAHTRHGVQSFIVTVSPENTASLRMISQMGFRRIGSHIDEEDGPEDIFEWVVGRPS